MERTLDQIAEESCLTALFAFGSRAKETADFFRDGSGKLSESGGDVDIAVLPDAHVVLRTREKVELALKLEELLGAVRVDLVILPEADPFVAANAVRGERIYCRDEHRTDEYELYLLRRAGDLIPLERERLRIIFGETE